MRQKLESAMVSIIVEILVNTSKGNYVKTEKLSLTNIMTDKVSMSTAVRLKNSMIALGFLEVRGKLKNQLWRINARFDQSISDWWDMRGTVKSFTDKDCKIGAKILEHYHGAKYSRNTGKKDLKTKVSNFKSEISSKLPDEKVNSKQDILFTTMKQPGKLLIILNKSLETVSIIGSDEIIDKINEKLVK